ncbi:MAG: group III truncated hemoglobin [Candidatus Competibacterales bacterium]
MVGERHRRDLDTPGAIAQLVDDFYRRVLNDSLLAPVFLEVAAINLERHKPLIRAYWEKLLLGGKGYRRHTIAVHTALHRRGDGLQPVHFARWLALFEATVEDHFAGPRAERAKVIARRVAVNMAQRLGVAFALPRG